MAAGGQVQILAHDNNLLGFGRRTRHAHLVPLVHADDEGVEGWRALGVVRCRVGALRCRTSRQTRPGDGFDCRRGRQVSPHHEEEQLRHGRLHLPQGHDVARRPPLPGQRRPAVSRGDCPHLRGAPPADPAESARRERGVSPPPMPSPMSMSTPSTAKAAPCSVMPGSSLPPASAGGAACIRRWIWRASTARSAVSKPTVRVRCSTPG